MLSLCSINVKINREGGESKIRRLIWVAIILALILAPLETMGLLRKGYDQLQTLAGSPESRSIVSKFKVELPKLSDSIVDLLQRLFPKFEVGVKEVK